MACTGELAKRWPEDEYLGEAEGARFLVSGLAALLKEGSLLPIRHPAGHGLRCLVPTGIRAL